jgi:pantothenate kinase
MTKDIPTLNFIKFETKYIESALDYMKNNLTTSSEEKTETSDSKRIKATGGGSIKYTTLITEKLNVM